MSKMCMRRSGALLLSVSLLLTTLSFPVYGEDGGSGAEAVS